MSEVKKVRQFKRTVAFSRPGPNVDEMIPDSYVAVFTQIAGAEYEAMRKVPGGMRDRDMITLALVGAEQVKNDDGATLTGADAVAYVLNDAIMIGASVRAYMAAIGEGIAAKNSKT